MVRPEARVPPSERQNILRSRPSNPDAEWSQSPFPPWNCSAFAVDRSSLTDYLPAADVCCLS